MTFSITTFGITTFSITAFSIMTLSITKFIIMTLNIMTFGKNNYVVSDPQWAKIQLEGKT